MLGLSYYLRLLYKIQNTISCLFLCRLRGSRFVTSSPPLSTRHKTSYPSSLWSIFPSAYIVVQTPWRLSSYSDLGSTYLCYFLLPRLFFSPSVYRLLENDGTIYVIWNRKRTHTNNRSKFISSLNMYKCKIFILRQPSHLLPVFSSDRISGTCPVSPSTLYILCKVYVSISTITDVSTLILFPTLKSPQEGRYPIRSLYPLSSSQIKDQ